MGEGGEVGQSVVGFDFEVWVWGKGLNLWAGWVDWGDWEGVVSVPCEDYCNMYQMLS